MRPIRKLTLLMTTLLGLVACENAFSQEFTRADTLRGSMRPERTAYDVKFYDLNLRIDMEEHSIRGYNDIYYMATADFKTLQIDLFANMVLDSITFNGNQLEFRRDYHAVFVDFPETQRKSSVESIRVFYHGQPTEAQRPPWDGGFVWRKDKNGDPWLGVACQGLGASAWWPNKDQLADEPDSVRMTFEIPQGLMCVSNGNLKSREKLEDGYERFVWGTSYPINNYNVTLNVARYAQLHDTYTAMDSSKLDLDYYVLHYNVAKAKKHFEQVKPMLACYEKYFGKYPFWNDGYALVETSYWGMEHQSAVAYGNEYKNNDGVFDYIIIHESAHEYWGNSVSANEQGQLWIQESFCTYSEALYMECRFDYARSIEYLKTQRPKIVNAEPIVGPSGVNYEGWQGSDMYYKGSWMLHTLRSVINDDRVWFDILMRMSKDFKYKNVSTEEVIAYIEGMSGKDLGPFFQQYLYESKPPRFVYKIEGKGDNMTMKYRWEAEAEDFDMPFEISVGDITTVRLEPNTKEWKTVEIKANRTKDKLKFGNDRFYVLLKEVEY